MTTFIGHVAVGSDAEPDHDVDTATLTLNDVQTQTTDHAIGLSNALTWTPKSNSSSRNLVVYDSLAVPSPRAGVTVPQSIALSANHWIGIDAASAGTITEIAGLNVNNSIAIAGTVTVSRNYGIRILDQTAIAGISAPARSAAIQTANNNWFKWLNAAGSADIAGMKVNEDDAVEFGTKVVFPAEVFLTSGNTGTNGKMVWLIVAGAGGAFTLPVASGYGSAIVGVGLVIIRNLDAANALQVNKNAADTSIDGGANISIAANKGKLLVSTGTDWYTIAD